MSSNLPTRRYFWVAAGAAAVSSLLFFSSLHPDPVHADGPLRVAKSICDAHRLRAMKEEDPRIEIEIPPAFDKPWPSRAACEANRLRSS